MNEKPDPSTIESSQLSEAEILSVINQAALTYAGRIPPELYGEPYLTPEKLRSDLAKGVTFRGLKMHDELVAVMGIQSTPEATLIRHVYVRPAFQGQGFGTALVRAAMDELKGRPVLVGCLTSMPWAINFYQKLGFELLPPEEILPVRRRLWTLPEAHLKRSVALGNPEWFDRQAAVQTSELNTPQRYERGIQMLELLYNQITDHKAVRDRWFQYYLTIIGLPLGIFAALSQGALATQKLSTSIDIYGVGIVVAGVFTILGILFFLLFVVQRINYLSVYSRALRIEGEIINPTLYGTAPHFKVASIGQFRADSYAIGVHILLNSCWFGLGVYCLLWHASWPSLLGLKAAIPTSAFALTPIVALSLAVAGQILVRQRLLAAAEINLAREMSSKPKSSGGEARSLPISR